MRVENEMATRIAIDTVGAANSLKGLTNAVSAATNSWKSQEIALKNTGDSMGAAKAKVDGLGNTIDAQKRKIEELKSRQQGLNTENQKDAETYLKLQKQIDASTKQLGSYEAQQTKAKNSLNYYSSGLADLRKGYSQSSELSRSFANRLQAEGKETEANKAKLGGLKQGLANLSEQYKIQESNLKRIASESGNTSDAYKRQQVRLNETATAMAKTKGEARELEAQMNKKPSGFLAGVREKLSGVNDKAEKTSHLFANLVGAHLVADGITNGLASIQAHFSELSDAVKEYDDKQQTMQATWTTLSGSSGKGKAMVDMGNQLSVAFGQNIEIVDELNQQFYHVLDNEPATKKLTSSVLTMADAVGLSSENTKNLGLNFTHMMSSSLLQLGDFNHITDALPMYGEALLKYEQKVQKNSKLTMAELRDEMSAGKISAKDAQTVMEQLGGKYQEASENLMKTAPGMVRQIKAQAPALLDAVVSPIRKMKNPFLGQISKWVGDKNTKQEFSDLGSTLVFQVERITKAFGGAKKINIGDILDKGIFKLHTGINELGNIIVKNKGNIKDLTNSFKTGGATSIKVFTQTLKDLEPVLKLVGNAAEKHPKAFTEMAAGMLVANKATQGLNLAFSGLGTVFKLSSGIFSTIKFPFNQISKMSKEGTKANKVLSGMKSTFSTLGSVFKTVGSGIGAAAKFAFSSVVNQAKLMGKGLAAVGKAGGRALKFTAKLGWSAVKSGTKLLGKSLVATGKASLKALKFTAKVSVKAAQLALKGLLKTAKLTGSGLKAAFNFAKANPFIAIASAIAALVVGLIALYKHNKKFRDFVNGIVKSAASMAKGVSKWFTALWKDSVKVFNTMFKAVKPIFSSGFNVINSYGRVFKDLFTGNWQNLDKDVRGVINSLVNFFKTIFKGAFNFLNNLTGGRLGDMVNTFKSYFGRLGGIVSDAAGAVRKGAIGLARGVIRPVNTMLEGLKSGLNWVLSKVGASEIKASWSIPLPAYANGTKGGHKGGLALVNDGNTSRYREMYRLPTGQVGMFPATRNLITKLPKGAEVLDGESSFQLANMLGLPAYKNGIGSFFGGIWDKAKDIAEDAEKIIAHPIKFMESVFSKFVKNIGKGFSSDVITAFPKMIANGATNWVKKLFDDFGGSSAPAGSGVQRWKSQVIKALKANGLSTSSAMVNKVLRQINTESGGNEKAMGGTDGLADGRAMGLMQVKPGTFNANRFPGHNNIMNGYDSLLAGLNYAKKRYGSDLSFLGKGHGYANGGLINTHGLYEIAEDNKQEMVIPLDITKRTRANQLLGEVVSQFSNDSSQGNTIINQADTTEAIAKLGAKFDTLLAMFGQLLGLNGAQLQAIKESGFDKDKQYKQQALDQAMRDVQAY
ncbi:hypothetical protein FGL79_08905 [Latilactobacillus curvatus]|uniref:tape measure protein n=1 Tax=Latilactobacillus curvatus TaxID=28038 RepID=UPI0011BB3AD1|nr:tape measure protein [Latilactobacillus curvatus]QEA49912.1 hypothetical protein FGL79_08905 [Latilactobacillus curvatus]